MHRMRWEISCSSIFRRSGAKVTAGQQIGEVESTKTTSTIYTPVSGTIAKINTELKDHPRPSMPIPMAKAGWPSLIHDAG